MRKLKWAELPKFNQLKWKPLYSDPSSSETSAFVKSHKNLAFFWILRAGHMVSGCPARAPRGPEGAGGAAGLGAHGAFGARERVEAPAGFCRQRFFLSSLEISCKRVSWALP